jgi:hypothetical protein
MDQWQNSDYFPDHLDQWLGTTFKIIDFDYLGREQIRLWFQDPDSAILFRLKH